MADMKRVLPVLIHHESNAKPQTGGKKNQAYLRFCIDQACKYNEKVVLIGDEANQKWCRDWQVSGIEAAASGGPVLSEQQKEGEDRQA